LNTRFINKAKQIAYAEITSFQDVRLLPLRYFPAKVSFLSKIMKPIPADPASLLIIPEYCYMAVCAKFCLQLCP